MTRPYTIRRAFGELRKAGAAYLEREHYLRSAGGSGQLFVVERDDGQVAGACLIGKTTSRNCDRSIAGACLIGPAPSKDAERSIAGDGVLIRQIKRSHLLDDVPQNQLCESQLLRHVMQAVCNEYDRTVLFVSYADPAAHDERTGMPLLGHCYLAAGFFFIGETRSRRYCVIDHLGRARSTRQGKITLTRKTLPKAGDTFHGEPITRDWQMQRLPPARIWIAVCTPDRMTRKQAKSHFLAVWRHINPTRQVAARIWISHVAWRRLVRRGRQSLGEPRPQHMRQRDRFQPAWWSGDEMTRTAAPVWVPFQWQHELILESNIAGERTARRTYAPLQHITRELYL
jgi:hypothetical protein